MRRPNFANLLDVITLVYTMCTVDEPCRTMVLELKLRKVGNSVGVVLPKEALAHLKAEEGDTVTLTEAQDGIRLTVGKA